MAITFHYEPVGKSHFGIIWRPIAKVVLTSPVDPKIQVAVWTIVDTGADYTILPEHFAQKLRISLEKDCWNETTFGVGGAQPVYFLKRKVIAQLGDCIRHIPLAFFATNEVPALLGRLGFMETFDVEFLKSHQVVFKD